MNGLGRALRVWGVAFKLAARVARSDRRYAVAVMVPTALATGGLLATLAVVEAVWLRALPFESPDQLAVLFTLPPNARDTQYNPLRASDFVELRERVSDTMHLAGAAVSQRAVRLGADATVLRVGQLSASVFDTLRVEPPLGRRFSMDEDERREKVALLSHGVWQSALGADANVLGRSIAIDGEGHTVIGVMPASFDIAIAAADVWVPLGVSRSFQPTPTATFILGLARLRDGVSLQQANASAAAAMERLGQDLAATHRGWRAGVLSWRAFQYGDQRRVVLMLLGAALLLFVIAATNIVSATLNSTLSRSGSVRTAMALGADGWQLVREQMALTVSLAVAGGIIGLLLAHAALRYFEATNPAVASQLGGLRLNWIVWTIGFTCLTLAAVGAGLLAVRVVLRHSSTTSGQRIIGSRLHSALRQSFCAAQVCVVVVLVATACAVGTALMRAAQIRPGFDANGVTSVQLRMPLSLYPTVTDRATAVERFLQNVREIHGVSIAAVTTNNFRPGAGIATLVQVEGRPKPDGSPHFPQVRYISDRYFEAMRIPLIAGRGIDYRDHQGSPLVAVVSRLAARSFWGDEDVLGRTLRRHAGDMPPFTVVGVVEDVSDVQVGQPPDGVLYLAYAQINFNAAPVSIVIRTDQYIPDLPATVRQAITSVNPDQPIYAIAPLEDFVRASFSQQWMRTEILGAIAVIGLCLALGGIYAAVGRSILERTPEIAIRRALGAGSLAVCRAALIEVSVGVVIGIVLSIPLGLLAMRNAQRIVPDFVGAGIAVPAGVLIVGAAVMVSIVSLLPRIFRVDAVLSLRGH